MTPSRTGRNPVPEQPSPHVQGRAASCVLFFPDGWLGVSPTLLTLLDLLSERGYSATVYALEHELKPLSLPARVQVRYFRRLSASWPFSIVFRGRVRQRLGPLIPAMDSVFYIAQSVVSAMRRRRDEPAATPVSIGVDRIGAMAALAHQLISKTPYIWLSLELRDGERARNGRAMKRVLGSTLRRADGFVVQDDARLQAALRLYGSDHPSVFFVPNGPAGSASTADSDHAHDYFRNMFGLDADEYPHILLHAGAITEDFYSLEVATGFKSLAGCALVFHERTKRSENEPLLREMRAVNTRNLFLSLTPVAYDQIDSPFAGATIGLAFYRPFTEDHSEIAMASGKLAFYLKHGKPVLMNDLPSFRRLLREYPFGVIIADPSDPQEVQGAVTELLDNYDTYSEQARRCFTDLFDMSHTAQPLLQLLDSLSGRVDVVRPVAATASPETRGA